MQGLTSRDDRFELLVNVPLFTFPGTFYVSPEPVDDFAHDRSGAARYPRKANTMAEQPVILVVEDNREIQSIIGNAFDEHGFEVTFTESGEEAVMLLKGFKGQYRALVIDVALRGRMTGWEVGTRARQFDASFPVVYISGVYAHQWALRGVPNSMILTKPFDPQQLVAAISNLLNTS